MTNNFDANKGLKLTELYIEDYKVFKDFKIDFTDNDDNPLPIIVLAGVNGSGKTTLLKYIEENNQLNKIKNFVDIFSDSKNVSQNDAYEKNIYYINAYQDQTSTTKTSIIKFIDKIIYEDDVLASKAYKEANKFINILLKDIQLEVEFKRLNADKELIFIDKITDNEIIGLGNLSTGEKAIFEKILLLYFQDIKDQVILIDEPELSLHPSWQNRVLNLYENFALQNNCQIIIATHSPHIIGSARSEYIRLLTKEEDGNIKVIDDIEDSYGSEFSEILTDIMGVEDLRTPDINKKFTIIKNMIIQNRYDTQDFKDEWNELEECLGDDNFDLKLLKLEIASRKKDVQSN